MVNLSLDLSNVFFLALKKVLIGYKLFQPKEIKIIFSRDVVFDEAAIMKSPIMNQETDSPQQLAVNQKVDIETSNLSSIVPLEMNKFL